MWSVAYTFRPATGAVMAVVIVWSMKAEAYLVRPHGLSRPTTATTATTASTAPPPSASSLAPTPFAVAGGVRRRMAAAMVPRGMLFHRQDESIGTHTSRLALSAGQSVTRTAASMILSSTGSDAAGEWADVTAFSLEEKDNLTASWLSAFESDLHLNSDRIYITGTSKPNGEVSVDDTLTIYYKPPSQSYFRGTERTSDFSTLTFIGGFNGWDSEQDQDESSPDSVEEETRKSALTGAPYNVDDMDVDMDDEDEEDTSSAPMVMPLYPIAEFEAMMGRPGEDEEVAELLKKGFSHRGTIVVPNFARSIEFCVTDGVRYDLASSDYDGEEEKSSDGSIYGFSTPYFRIHVTHVKQLDPNNDQRILSYRHDPVTGELTLQKEAEDDFHDPLELERAVREEYERRSAQRVTKAASARVEEEDDDDDEIAVDMQVKEGALPQETVLTVREGAERSLREYMAEAEVYGKARGLGNVQIGEARQAFDMYDDDSIHRLPLASLEKALSAAGFDNLTADQMTDLVLRNTSQRPQDESNNDNETISMGEFVNIYADLDDEESGIEIV